LTFESSLNHLKDGEREKKENEIYELDFRVLKLKLLNSFLRNDEECENLMMMVKLN
jgi:hypothetical protein